MRLTWHKKQALKTECDKPIHVFMRMNPKFQYKIQLLKTIKSSTADRKALEERTAHFIKQRAMKMRVLKDAANSEFKYNGQMYLVLNSINNRKQCGATCSSLKEVIDQDMHAHGFQDDHMHYAPQYAKDEYYGFLNRNFEDVVLRAIFIDSFHSDYNDAEYDEMIKFTDETSGKILSARERFRDGRGTMDDEYVSDSGSDDSDDSDDDNCNETQHGRYVQSCLISDID
jgi:hypothetical protein